MLRLVVRGSAAGYLASVLQVQEGRFGHERALASDVPFTLPRQRLLELNSDPECYGEELTDALFANQALLTAWQRARDQAERIDRGLQVRIEIDPSAAELHYICWETLLDPERRHPLAQSARTPLVRHIHASSGVPLASASPGELRALVVVAGAPAPPGYGLPRIDAQAECARIAGALGAVPTLLLGTAIGPGTPPASLSRIRAALQQRVTIVYVVCHGALLRDVEGRVHPYLWMETDQGALAPVKAHRLVDLVAALDAPLRPTLVVFSSCHSADEAEEARPRRGYQAAVPGAIAPRLAAAGVGAVIGMQGRVQQQFIARFVPRLFEQLFAGEPIDRAIAIARADTGEGDWWAPVLYLRGDNAFLWQAAEERIASAALHSVAGLLAGPAAREVIGRFQQDLRRAIEQLPLLKAYKDIHDQLHHLLVRGVYCIERILGPRLAEPATASEFEGYYIQARMSIELLYAAAKQLPRGNLEQPRIAQLERSYQRLALAVERQDSAGFKAAILEIYSGLGTLPVFTNRSIVEQVRVLQIERLSAMMLELQGAVGAAQAAPGVGPLFAARARELHQLKLDLQALVERHAAWQALDMVVRLLEQQGDTELIPYHWQELQIQVAAVSGLEPEATRAALREQTAGLELALGAGDDRRLLRALDRLALEVRLRFFELDKQLKERCDGLQPLGAEFKLLLDVLIP